MKRGHGRNDYPARGAMPCNRGLAEKNPLTNRIRRQFARIKAFRTDGCRSWLLWKLATARRAARRSGQARSTKAESGHFEAESQDISKTTVRTFRIRNSGHFEDQSQDT